MSRTIRLHLSLYDYQHDVYNSIEGVVSKETFVIGKSLVISGYNQSWQITHTRRRNRTRDHFSHQINLKKKYFVHFDTRSIEIASTHQTIMTTLRYDLKRIWSSTFSLEEYVIILVSTTTFKHCFCWTYSLDKSMFYNSFWSISDLLKMNSTSSSFQRDSILNLSIWLCIKMFFWMIRKLISVYVFRNMIYIILIWILYQ